MPEAQRDELLRRIQNKVGFHDRDTIAREVGEATRGRLPSPFSGARSRERLERLRTRGICSAPLGLDTDQCREVTQYFEATPCYAAHVPGYSDGIGRTPGETQKSSSYGSYKLEQSLLAPQILEIALDPRVLDLGGGYIGCVPSLYSINTFWTFPSLVDGLTHGFHRDEDDYRFVALFIYWTDVSVGEGEFYFIEKTHDFHAVEARLRRARWLRLEYPGTGFARTADEFRKLNGGNGYYWGEVYSRLFDGNVICVSGPAGSAVVADTFGLHRGSPPRTRRRLCTWIRYGLYANDAYKIDKTEPCPSSLIRGRVSDDKTTRFVTRLVLDWDR